MSCKINQGNAYLHTQTKRFIMHRLFLVWWGKAYSKNWAVSLSTQTTATMAIEAKNISVNKNVYCTLKKKKPQWNCAVPARWLHHSIDNDIVTEMITSGKHTQHKCHQTKLCQKTDNSGCPSDTRVAAPYLTHRTCTPGAKINKKKLLTAILRTLTMFLGTTAAVNILFSY